MTNAHVEQIKNTPDRPRPWLVFAIAGILVVLGATAIQSVPTNNESTSTTTNTSLRTDEDLFIDISIGGEPLAPMPGSGLLLDSVSDPAVGTIAPTVRGTNFAGTPAAIEADGRPKAIYFVAHWCQECQVELSSVIELIEKDALPSGLDIISVSTSVDTALENFPPDDWFARQGWTPNVIRDTHSNDAFVAYGSGPLPFVVFLDGENRVIARSSGALDEDQTMQMWATVAATSG